MSAPWRLELFPRPRVLAAVGAIAATLVIGVGPLVPGGTPEASAAADNRLAEMASPSPFRGLVYDGLTLAPKGSACDGVFEAKTTKGASLGCSHGPDPAPPGVDVRRGRSDNELAADLESGLDEAPQPAVAASATDEPGSADATTANGGAEIGSIGCIGDGVSGARVQAIYAVAADRTDRSATVIPAIRATYAPRVDWQFNQSAAETGAEAHVTFVTEPDAGSNCQLSVVVAHLSAAGDDSFSSTASELKALGFNRPDRKYLVWTDANVLCGVGSVFSDAKPGLSNLNNGYAPMFARVDAACWNYAEGHELMHTLGSVQQGAPHATSNGHCYDEADEMCYDDDGSGPATMITVCSGRNGSLFDCNHDDYFYAGTPPALNWLATHWNTYNSNWLLRGPLPNVAGSGVSTGGSTGTGTTGGTTGTGGGTTGGTGTDTGTTGGTGSGGTGTGGTGTGIGGNSTGTNGTTITVVPPLPIPPFGPVISSPGGRASGYWMLTADGHVDPFGDAGSFGQPYPMAGGAKAVDLEPTPSGGGYWILDDSGRVRAYGDAESYGSVPTALLARSERAVSLSATPSGGGYWVFTNRGRVVPFGDAGFFGDVSDVALNRPVIGSVATPSGQGYYLFASDGGIFTFGDAAFFGSTGALHLNRPVVAMAVAPNQGGYWLVGADGGLFAFGQAGFFGSMGAVHLNRPVSAVVPGQAGYLMVGEDGGAFSFGDVNFFGSLAGHPPTTPVVSVALKA
jgi:hypothetical protein